MFNRSKRLFIYKKTNYIKKIVTPTFLFCLLTGFFFTRSYLEKKINNFLQNQQILLKQQHLFLQFSSVTPVAWTIWPQIKIQYPKLQKESDPSSVTFWQAKQANVSYSLLHPFSISIQIDGEQLFCSNKNIQDCIQIHGRPWNIRLPISNSSTNNFIHIQCSETFYQNKPRPIWNIKSLQLKNIKARLYWNPKASLNKSLAFSEINIQQALVNFSTLDLQRFEHIKTQTALISTPIEESYKLLVQKADFSWNDLSVYSAGKLHISLLKTIPTGEMTFHLDGVNQTIHQQLGQLNCCHKLKEELSHKPLPSQINFTIFIHDGVLYLGGVPLETAWINKIKALIDHYKK